MQLTQFHVQLQVYVISKQVAHHASRLLQIVDIVTCMKAIFVFLSQLEINAELNLCLAMGKKYFSNIFYFELWYLFI